MADLTLVIAFVAGLVSFLSPCVLPIVPGFLSYLAGASLSDSETKRWNIFANSLFFVLGFSVIFALLGVLLNTILEAVAYDVQVWLARVGGALIIFFGLYLTGLIRLPFLEKEHKVAVTAKFKSRYLTSFVFGAAFAAGGELQRSADPRPGGGRRRGKIEEVCCGLLARGSKILKMD